eukprot:jgi/Galph1/2293/GphlegSOOS_G973.1
MATRPQGALVSKRQTTSSRYDYVKVRIWLGSNYYVFSRFTVTQLLMLCRVPQNIAQKIALKLKKQLVDQGLLDIQQSEWSQQLFQVAQWFGIKEPTFELYTRVLQFYQLKLPFIILLYGVNQIALTTVAVRVAERLNIYNVLDTETIFAMDKIDSMTQEEYGNGYSIESMKEEDTHKLAQMVIGNMEKCLREGKALIIYGAYIEPQSFASFIERYKNESKKHCILQYFIYSSLLDTKKETFSQWLDDSSLLPLYQKLSLLQQRYTIQTSEMGIQKLTMDDTNDSVIQVVEQLHEDYLQVVVSNTENH